MSFTVEEQIAAILSPVFGGELYPVVHPDPDGTMGSVANLYAVYTKIGGVSFNRLTGDDPMSRPRIQVSIYSIDYGSLKASEAAMNVAMQAANQVASDAVDAQQDCFEILGALANVSSSVGTDGFENDTRRYFVHTDFYAWARN